MNQANHPRIVLLKKFEFTFFVGTKLGLKLLEFRYPVLRVSVQLFHQEFQLGALGVGEEAAPALLGGLQSGRSAAQGASGSGTLRGGQGGGCGTDVRVHAGVLGGYAEEASASATVALKKSIGQFFDRFEIDFEHEGGDFIFQKQRVSKFLRFFVVGLFA